MPNASTEHGIVGSRHRCQVAQATSMKWPLGTEGLIAVAQACSKPRQSKTPRTCRAGEDQAGLPQRGPNPGHTTAI
eukprot:9770847-Heterocapsa_arctica.AAC.1